MSSKRPLEDFYLNTPDEEAVYEAADSTTVDDSYLAHLSERLAQKGEDGAEPGAPPPEPIADVAIGSAGVVPVEAAHAVAPPVGESSDVMEVGDSDLVPLEDSAGQVFSSAGAEPGLSEPLPPGPSDLLQAVPPPPAEEPQLDPEVDPATYDAPTFVRPSLVEQDPMPVLEIVGGNEKGRAYRLEKQSMSLGRGLDNDVVVTDIAVSRRHIRFVREGMQVTVQDMGSGNGTLVNGSRVASFVLSGTDRIEVGNTVFRVVFPGQDSFPPPPANPGPAPSPAASPLHNRSTAYLGDGQGQQVLQQIGVVGAGQAPGMAPTPAPVEPGGQTDGIQLARPQKGGVPRSFKIAMAALAGIIVLIGVVGLVAAILHARGRGGAQTSASEEPTAEGLFAEGREAYVERRWGQAADSFERVLALAPENSRAREFLAQARAEERNQGTLEAARQALAEENFEDAVATLRIPQSSVYSSEAGELRREAQQRQSVALVAEARRYRDRGDQEAARAHAQQALDLNPANSEARTLLAALSGEGGSTETPAETPGETTGPAVAVAPSGPTARPGGRPGRPPRGGGGGRPSRPERPSKASSAGISQIIGMYKRGQFGPAGDRARELSASGSSDSERSRARGLARKIDRFAKVWRGVQSGGSARQKMSYLESALRLDQQISGGHFGPQIRPKLRQAYEGNAQRAWRAGQYASACQSALRALKIDRGASEARAISSKCDSKARQYYESGARAERSDVTKAKSYWRKVLNMVPRSSPWYSKAYTSLNNAGRRRHMDEDE